MSGIEEQIGKNVASEIGIGQAQKALTAARSMGGIGKITAAGKNDAGLHLVTISGQGKPWADSHPLNGLSWSADPRLNGGQITEQTLTSEEWDRRLVTAAAIILAGSGANPRAKRLRGTGAGNAPAGGYVNAPNYPATSVICRGLWQFASDVWKVIPDAVAFDATAATAAVFAITDGFRPERFTDWAGSPGLDTSSPYWSLAAAAMGNRVDALVDKGILGLPGEAAVLDAIQGAVTPPLEWAAALGRLLSNLLSGDWWKRIGIAALGVLVLVLVFVATPNTVYMRPTAGK